MARTIHRFLRMRKHLKLFLVLVLGINISFILELFILTHVFPNTYIGTTNISGKSPSDINALISSYLTIPYTIQAQDRSYTYTYSDLGITIDILHAQNMVFAKNRLIYPLNILLFLRSYLVPRHITMPLTFTQQFGRFITQTIFDFSVGPDDIVFNPEEKSLLYVENQIKYRIDESFFVNLLRERAGNNTTPLYPKLVKIENEKAKNVGETNDRIKRIFLEPLTVFIDVGGSPRTFILSEGELVKSSDIVLSNDQTTVEIRLHDEYVTNLINDHIARLGLLARGNIATQKVKDDLTEVLTARYEGHGIDALTIEYDKGANTTGDTAKKYVEIDISQQKMYLFKNGKLTKAYRVSTGKDYPTPVGEFAIINKSGVGYSPQYHVWMPYWMGFYLDPKLHAYFGIHELPFYYVGSNKIQRPREFIGTPNTGGCVALDIGAAREVYQFADIGTPVVIFP